MNKTNCNKCGGSGKIRAFKHIANGMCFACKGTGRMVEINVTHVTPSCIQDLTAQYSNDPRLGNIAKKRCNQSEAYAREAYRGLQKIDNGLDAPHILRNLKN